MQAATASTGRPGIRALETESVSHPATIARGTPCWLGRPKPTLNVGERSAVSRREREVAQGTANLDHGGRAYWFWRCGTTARYEADGGSSLRYATPFCGFYLPMRL